MATEIKTGTSLLTLINVFTTTPDNQEQLLKILLDATEVAMAKQPGFVSANLHKSTDGLRITNYVQWESLAHFQAMLENPECLPHMAEAEAMADLDKHMYEVVETYAFKA